MLKLPRTLLLTIVLIAMFIATGVLAQDDTETALIPEELSGTYLIDLSTVEIAVTDEEDVFTVTANDVSDQINWVVTAPFINAGVTSTFDFVENWIAAPEGLTAEAIIQTETQGMFLTISNPLYDPELGTLTFTATNVEAYELEESKDGPVIEGEFEDAALYITSNVDFASGILQGAEARLASTRTVSGTTQCTPGYNCPGDARR